jgi:O-antigen/teichoic acid export membrane protein
VARLGSLDDLGYYSAAAVVAAGIYQVVLPVFHSFYPKLSYLHATHAEHEFSKLFLRLALVVGFVAGVPIAIIMLNAHDVLFAWTGEESVARRAGPVLAWLCLGSLGNAMFHAPLAALLATGRQAIAARTTTIMTVVLLPCLYLGWKVDGLVGVASAWGIALTCWYLATLVKTVLSVTGARARWPAVLLSLAPFGAALAIGAGIHRLSGPLSGDQLSRALAVIAIAATVTVATAAIAWLADRRLILSAEAAL